MAQKRIYPDNGMTKQQRYQDNQVKIDERLEEAYSNIDWNRRRSAQINLVEFTKRYLIGLALDEPPSKKGEEVLMQMDRAIREHSNYAIALHRGAGKSAFCICAAIYAIVTGLQKFVVIIAHNAGSSSGLLNDIWKVFAEPETDLANDYPDVFLPWHISQGSYRRRYTFKGIPIEIKKTANELVLPTYRDQRFKGASGSLIVTRSITGGLRGIRHGTMRPSMVFLDDLQTTETAKSQEGVQKILDTIKGDIMPLAGKSRLSILQTFTPICVDDLVHKIKDDPNWTTTIYPAILTMPNRMDMWDEYLKMYNEEGVAGVGHEGSLQFYKDNFDEMNEGASTFNPHRFSEADGHLSMLQKLIEIRNQIGEQAFQAEYMMNPTALQFQLPITPKTVASRTSTLREMEIPTEGVQCVIASSDLNLSKWITTTIVLFTNNHTITVIWHKFRKCRIPVNIPEEDYYKRVYNLLGEHGREIQKVAQDHNVKIDAWAIDANGTPYGAVLDFCRNSRKICGLSACGFVGRASHLYRSFARSRLKEDMNRTLLCGDEQEHKVAGSGRRWTYFDSDLYHEKVQKGFLQEMGNIGSMTLFNGGNHAEWAIQICNEKLMAKRSRPDGTIEYTWKDVGDHDALDSIGQALAAHATFGFATAQTGRTSLTASRQRVTKRKKIKIV